MIISLFVFFVLLLAVIFVFWPYPIRTESDLAFWSLFNTLYLIKRVLHFTPKAQFGKHIEQYFNSQDFSLFPSLESEERAQKETCIVSVLGDILPNELIHNAQYLYAGISNFVFGADFKTANLETNYDPNLEFSGNFGDFRMNVDKTAFENLMYDQQERTFDLVCTANNMGFRYGYDGIRHTLENLDIKGIHHVGTARCAEEAEAIPIVDINGIRFAFLAYTYGTNGVAVDEGREYTINTVRFNALDESCCDLHPIFNQIKTARKLGADIIIGHLHWGREFEHYPYLRQIEIAHQLFESGMNIIIGHHAHVAQPMEVYHTNDARTCFCVYSLGSVTDYYTFHRSNFCSALRLIFVRPDSETRVAVLEKVEVLPIWLKFNKRSGNDAVRLVPISKDLSSIPSSLSWREQWHYKKVYRIVSKIYPNKNYWGIANEENNITQSTTL